MANFNQTLAETKATFSYNLNTKPEKLFAKLKSTKPDNRDVHGSTFKDRVLLEVTSIDLDSRQCFVRNPNGFEWLTKLSSLIMCDKDGNSTKWQPK